jgi:hypothetical protein
LPDDVTLPVELQRREDRLEAIRQARADIEARVAAECDAPARAEYETKVQAREAQRQQGKKPKGNVAAYEKSRQTAGAFLGKPLSNR